MADPNTNPSAPALADGQPTAFEPPDLPGDPSGPAAEGAAPDSGGGAADTSKLDLVLEIPVRLSVELGRTEIPIRDVLHLGRGSMVELDRGPGAPLDVRVNGVLIGRGEVVVVNEEKLGLRFIDVVSQAERVKRLR
ncbi:MAG TPA: flagellar motor switch protein FliN [Stellaceae bacterium]|nr:flagellar motor switch protein FliN [Stellaceae bacterium]